MQVGKVHYSASPAPARAATPRRGAGMLRAGNLKYFLGGAALSGAPSMYMLHQDVWKSQQL